jgi:hypothetical protein
MGPEPVRILETAVCTGALSAETLPDAAGEANISKLSKRLGGSEPFDLSFLAISLN